MNRETIESFIRQIGMMVSAADTAKRMEGLTKRERNAVELMQDAAANLKEELESRAQAASRAKGE